MYNIKVVRDLVGFSLFHIGNGNRNSTTTRYGLVTYLTPLPKHVSPDARGEEREWRIPSTRVIHRLATKYLASECKCIGWGRHGIDLHFKTGVSLEDRAAFLAAIAANAHIE